MKTKKELEAEEMTGNKLGYLNALKDVLELIDELPKWKDEHELAHVTIDEIEQLKSKITG